MLNYRLLAGLAVLVILSSAAQAEDGIWLWNQRPKAAVGASGNSEKRSRSLDISDALAENLRLATVRLNDGAGSGSFVSSTGLLLTNQHLVAGCIAKLSD